MNFGERQMLKEVIDNQEKLSEWEEDFIINIDEKGDEYILSERQHEVLYKCYKKAVL